MSSLSESTSVNTAPVTNTPSVVTETANLDSLLAQLIQEGESLRNDSRTHLSNIKKVLVLVNKERKTLRKKGSRVKRTIVQKVQPVNKHMQKFMKENKSILSTDTEDKTVAVSNEYVRRDMMRIVSAYIKRKDLQIASDRKKWLPDKTLKTLFKIKDPKAEFSFMNVNGLITRVIVS